MEYHGGYHRKTDKKPRRSLFVRLFDSVMTLVTLAVAVAMGFVCLAPYVSPASIWIFSIFGLTAPIIYVATLLLALYWVVRWRWMQASVMLLLVFLGLFKVSLFYKPEFRRVYDEPAGSERGILKFMTYNVRNFYGEDGQSSAEEVLRLVTDTDPDIVCMQEFNPQLVENLASYDTFLNTYDYSAGGRSDDPATQNMALFSKYRILRWGPSREHIPEDGFRESVWADVLIGRDTVRIFNNHLHSTAIKADDNDFITQHRYISDTDRDAKFRSIVRRLRDNNILRAGQVDSIAVTIESTPYARIVCGDFNDTPMSYVYRRMSCGLNDAFREAGMGYSYTFRGFFNTLRIDYVLSDDDFETLSYQVGEVDYSDHLPVIVRLRYTPRH